MHRHWVVQHVLTDVPRHDRMVKWFKAMYRAVVREHQGVPADIAADVEDVHAWLHEVREVLTHPAVPLVAVAQAPTDVLVVTDDAHSVLADGYFVSLELHVC